MFIHPALTWGFFLALVPLLIHLINLVRRRRVKWAAMEFLLQSYKKHQKWVWLQQLALLLLRMLAIVAIVAMLAQWVARSHWLALFGGRVTHHYVLLDDSYSMAERYAGVSAFERATQSLSRIAAQAMAQETTQKLTLIRFSRALGFRKDDATTAIGQLADLNAEVVDPRFDVLLEEKRRGLAVTDLAPGPRAAWELTAELLRQSQDESSIVHVLSAFRHKEWANPAELKQLISEIDEASDQIQFVNCAPENQQSNLGIVDVRPAEDIRAAGVPLRVNVTIANHGSETARNVPVRVRTTFYDPQIDAAAEPGQLQGRIEEPPAVLIEELPPGQTTTRQVQVYFPQPGEHVVEVSLPDDVVHTDNRRWCVVRVEQQESVLVIDGDPDQRNVFFLTAAFEPGPRTTTGVRVDAKSASYLRDTSPEALDAYHAIYLLDVNRLDDRAIENLEAFVRRGGGLAIFVGGEVQLKDYTSRLYRDGNGLLPVPLDRDQVLRANADEDVPDIEVSDHPLFSVFLGDRSPFIRLVNVDRFLAPRVGWVPPANSTVSILARLRNRQPLVVEQRFGEGRVVVFLTTLAPLWNNWANNPSFVVVMLKLQSYLASPRRPLDTRLAGTSLTLPLDAETYRKDVMFVTPGRNPQTPLVLKRSVSAAGPGAESAKGASSALLASLPGVSTDDANTARAGIYEVWLATIAGPLHVRRFAFNVDPAESDITQVSQPALLASLAPISVRVRHADEFSLEAADEAGFYRGTWIIVLLVILLVAEQLLAYRASYHPALARGAIGA